MTQKVRHSAETSSPICFFPQVYFLLRAGNKSPDWLCRVLTSVPDTYSFWDPLLILLNSGSVELWSTSLCWRPDFTDGSLGNKPQHEWSLVGNWGIPYIHTSDTKHKQQESEKRGRGKGCISQPIVLVTNTWDNNLKEEDLILHWIWEAFICGWHSPPLSVMARTSWLQQDMLELRGWLHDNQGERRRPWNNVYPQWHTSSNKSCVFPPFPWQLHTFIQCTWSFSHMFSPLSIPTVPPFPLLFSCIF